MPRGFKVNRWATRQAHFSDQRSFVSISKVIPGECEKPKPHLILFGRDKTKMRARIFQRNREANADGIARCVQCELAVNEVAGKLVRPDGEWHHIRHRAGERCDCLVNGEVRCHHCHTRNHPRPMWSRVQNK